MNYYEELWQDLISKMETGHYEEVVSKLSEELKMPYVPLSYETKFKNLLKEAQTKLAPSARRVFLEEEELEESLFSTSLEVAVMAVNYLKELHIEKYANLIDEYLRHPIFDEIQAMLVYVLIEQGSGKEWEMTKDGCTISFIPKYCELPEETDGFVFGKAFLEEHLAKEPSLYQLCLELLSIHVLQQLPYAYEEDEAEVLALSVMKEAMLASDDEGKWEEMCRNNGWNSKKVVNF